MKNIHTESFWQSQLQFDAGATHARPQLARYPGKLREETSIGPTISKCGPSFACYSASGRACLRDLCDEVGQGAHPDDIDHNIVNAIGQEAVESLAGLSGNLRHQSGGGCTRARCEKKK